MASNIRLLAAGVAAVTALTTLSGCSSSALDGTYVQEENTADPADYSQLIHELTIKGNSCEMVLRADPGPESGVEPVEQVLPCKIRDNLIVYDNGQAEAEFEQTAEGDIRIYSTLLTKQ